ncbi:MAG: helix-turn-helix transcriptional regulator [Elusimicrobiales bacterium]|nr:helix-turn-helix transcriptional regulator [Elusimicrobiales bacterium]
MQMVVIPVDTLTRIFALLDEKGIEQKKFAVLLGTTDKTVSAWRTGRSKSFAKYLPKIAEVLGTTTDYLNYGTRPDAEHLTDEERQLLAAYRQADEKSRAMVRLALNMDSAEPPASALSEKAM